MVCVWCLRCSTFRITFFWAPGAAVAVVIVLRPHCAAASRHPGSGSETRPGRNGSPRPCCNACFRRIVRHRAPWAQARDGQWDTDGARVEADETRRCRRRSRHRIAGRAVTGVWGAASSSAVDWPPRKGGGHHGAGQVIQAHTRVHRGDHVHPTAGLGSHVKLAISPTTGAARPAVVVRHAGAGETSRRLVIAVIRAAVATPQPAMRLTAPTGRARRVRVRSARRDRRAGRCRRAPRSPREWSATSRGRAQRSRRGLAPPWRSALRG